MHFRALTLFMALGLVFSRPAHASLEEAESAYRRGAALERSADAESALVEYQGALAHYPNYFYAWRQIGNCYVRLRQMPKAIDAYNHYLAAKPTDLQVRDYADKLRKAYGEPHASLVTATDTGGEGRPAFYAGLVLSPVFLGMDDINALVPEGSTKAGSNLGLAYGLEGGWRHPSGFYVQAGGFMGLAKNHSWKENADLTDVSVKSSMSGFYLAPGYRMRLPVSLSIIVGGHLGVGLANIAFDHTSEMKSLGTKSSTSVNASPMLIVAEANAEYQVLPQLGIVAGLGYQSAELAKLDGGNGNLKNAKGEDAKLDFKGLRLNLGARWLF